MSDDGLNISPLHIRIALMIFLVFLIFSVIGIQLWNVQVNYSSEFKEKMSKQSARKIRIPPVRGQILAANGELLVGNRSSYDIVFHLSEMRLARRKKTIEHILEQAERVAKIIGRNNALDKDKVSRHMNLFPGIPMTVFNDLTQEELGRLVELAPPIDGMEIIAEPMRIYPHGSLAAHLIGYVGASDPQKADDRAEFFYYIPDMEGKAGIEKLYDEKLRGLAGQKLVLVDSRGFVHEELDTPTPSQDGHNIVLTLDLKAQKIAEDLLSGYNGAMIVMDATNGAVIAMASTPSYNPADFIPRITTGKYKELVNNPGKPFISKCTSGSYMPGSIIKPLTALACLESGLGVDHMTLCDGATQIGNVKIRCWSWRSGGHGELALEEAIQRSCNDFFIENALNLGIEKLSEMFRSAGIGQKTGFELAERSGILPAPQKNWTSFDTGLVSIGQGKIEVTPLQAIRYISAIANGGTLWKPYVIGKILDSDSNVVFSAVPEFRGRLAASKESLDIVRNGMFLAVNAQGGSAKNAKNSKIDLCGKTGTAEVGPKNDRYKVVWFAGFGTALQNKTTYSIIVMIEHGSSGGGTSAPLAKAFFERYLDAPSTAE